MPIYEYRCPACGHEFEKMVRLSDPIPPCPSCGAGEVRKLISQTSFVLKGGGWYSDHYGLKPGGDKKTESASAPAAVEKKADAPAAAPSPAAPSPPSGSGSGSGA